MVSTAYKEFIELCNSGAFKDAADFAERQALFQEGGREFWLTQQSRALLNAGQARKAYETANRAVHCSPGNHYALLARADALVKLGRFDDASEDYRESLNNPKTASRARRGVLLCLAQAKTDWSGILSLLSEWNMPPGEALQWRVQALAGLRRRDEAVSACHEWLRLKPDNPSALWQLTELEIERDGLESVKKRIGRLAKIPSRPSIYAEIYASLISRTGRGEQAVGEYKKLAQKNSSPRILRKQAFAMAKSGQETEAIPLMEELLRLNPSDVYIHSSYVAACKRIKNLERPCGFYQELIALHPDEKSLYGRLRAVQKGLDRI